MARKPTEITGNKPRRRVRGYIGGGDGQPFWVDTNSENRTINVPATGDIDEAGLADLYEFLTVAAKVAGIT